MAHRGRDKSSGARDQPPLPVDGLPCLASLGAVEGTGRGRDSPALPHTENAALTGAACIRPG